MITLTENQRGFLLSFSGFLLLVASINPPSGLQPPYDVYLRYAIGAAGVLGMYLQKALQNTKTKDPSLFDHINTPLDAFMRLSPEDQGKLLKAEQAIFESFKT
jgi:hypothetical protein